MHNKSSFTCPVCGYSNLDEAPYDNYGYASHTICPCCGTEFGYDDFSTTHLALQKKWIDSGMMWWSKNIMPPDDWNPKEQLERLDK
jgi:transcription elongation factor Elf1